ncbi:MAG: flagellar biosynthesis protein FlhB [Pseudomonadota bacterium]
MAENENGQEQTEEPTPKRLRDAKQKGQVPRSVDFNATLMTIFASLGLLVLGPGLLNKLSTNFRENFVFDKEQVFESAFLIVQLQNTITDTLWALAPFMVLMFFVAVVAPALMGGWIFSGNNLVPKLEKLNPIKGMARIFSVKGLMELLKSLLKVSVVGVIGLILFTQLFDNFMGFTLNPLEPAISEASSLLVWSLIAMACGMILIAAIDVPFQIWQHKKQLRMTRQEVKDELRETEGKPEVKSRIRTLQQQMANARMMDEVPKADVVITNPTHFSVALRYDQTRMRAPILVAKGTGLIALRIREIASDNGVEIVEAPPLARALYASTDLNQEIPSPLYVAVAQVLGFVFQLRMAREQGAPPPRKPDASVPDEFLASHNIETEGDAE